MRCFSVTANFDRIHRLRRPDGRLTDETHTPRLTDNKGAMFPDRRCRGTWPESVPGSAAPGDGLCILARKAALRTAMHTTSGASPPSRLLIVDNDVTLLEGVERCVQGGRGGCNVLFELRACPADAALLGIRWSWSLTFGLAHSTASSCALLARDLPPNPADCVSQGSTILSCELRPNTRARPTSSSRWQRRLSWSSPDESGRHPTGSEIPGAPTELHGFRSSHTVSTLAHKRLLQRSQTCNTSRQW